MNLRRITILNLASPYTLTLIPCAIFAFAIVFPPQLYTEYLGEHDLIFLDLTSILFFAVCVATFMVGVRSILLLRPMALDLQPRFNQSPSILYLTFPLCAGTFFCAIYLFLLGGKVDLFSLIAAQQGDTIKMIGRSGALDEGRWGSTLIALTGIIWWSFYRAKQFTMVGVTLWTYRISFAVALAMASATCIALVDRTSLMPIYAGIAVISFFWRSRRGNLSLGTLVANGSLLALGLIMLFLALSFLRGATGLHFMITGLLGYSIASYNRLAALLGGSLHYAYEGRGVYISRFLLTGSVFNKIYPIADKLGWPSTILLWETEFQSIISAGLNPAFNWPSAFGYLYSDVGYFAPIFLYLVGLLSGALWNSFRRGGVWGLILYPWAAFSVLFWMGTNIIFDFKIVILLEVTILLFIYDWFFLGVPDFVPNSEAALSRP